MCIFYCCILARSAAQPCLAPTLNGGYFVPEQETYSHETQLSYACDNGSKPAADGWWATSTCQNGEWSDKPQCIGKCFINICTGCKCFLNLLILR